MVIGDSLSVKDYFVGRSVYMVADAAAYLEKDLSFFMNIEFENSIKEGA